MILLLEFLVIVSSEILNQSGLNGSEEEDSINESADVSNENRMVEGGVNFTDSNESYVVNRSVVMNETRVGDLEGVDTIKDFYWEREVVNSYFGSGEKVKIRVKIPDSLKNISEEIERIKNRGAGQEFSISANSEENLGYLENELKTGMKNKYFEAEIENISLIKKIKFRDLKFEDNISLGVRELSEKRFVQSYAIDPSGMEFVNATVTLVAKGENLYKCKDWNFSLQECFGDWILFKEGLVPREEYSFTLTNDDSGFGEEINVTAANHLDENRNFISDIFDTVQFLDNVWSEFIHSGEYVRATFEKNMTNGNVINLFVRNVLGINSFIEIYEKDGSVVLGATKVINETGEYDVVLSGMEGYNDVFDIKVVGKNETYLEFDWIHDAPLSTFGGNFFEGFEGVGYTNADWIVIGGGTWNPDSTTMVYNGTEALDIKGSTSAAAWVEYNLSTANYTNIIFSAWYKNTANIEGADLQFLGWWNGTAWTDTLSTGANVGVYTLSNNTLPVGANNNPNLKIRLGCYVDSASEHCYFDDVRVGGTLITAPQVQFVIPTTPVGNYSQKSIVANVTATVSNLDKIKIYLYNSTELVNSIISSTSPLFYNFTNLSDGTYYLNATANNTFGFLNSTATRTIILYSSPPKWSNPAINKTSVNSGDVILFNTTWTNSALAGYIFSTNNTGSWVNSSYTSFSGTTNVSRNVSTIVAAAGQVVGWYFWANDSVGNSNQTEIQTFTVYNNPPSITLLDPENGVINSNGFVQFYFNVTDSDDDIDNCSLVLNGIINSSSTSITPNAEQRLDAIGLTEGDYSWKINCTDTNGNENSSASRNFSVVYLPNATLGTIIINQTIRDSQGTALNATIILTETGTGQADYNFSNGEVQNISSGTYNIRINFLENSFQTLTFFGVNVTSNITSLINVDNSSNDQFEKISSVSPLLIYNYSSANLTITATGGKFLFKCANWNFTNQNCIDEKWRDAGDISLGQNYTIVMQNFSDSGFGELNTLINVLDVEGNLIPFEEAVIANKTETYDLLINLTANAKVVQVIVYDLNVSAVPLVDLKIQESVPVPTGFVSAYAIDASDLEFSNATFVIVASEEDLYKCTNWSFSSQSCIDNNWTLFKTGLIPGDTYTFTLTPGDPGFAGIINNTYYLHNESSVEYPSYKQLLKTYVDSPQANASAPQVARNVINCFEPKWITQNFTSRTMVNGTWTFNVYTNCTVLSKIGEYFLFARILKVNSTGEFNTFNTSNAGFACALGAPVLKSWSDSSINLAPLEVGERVGIQICEFATKDKIAGSYTSMFWENSTPSNVVIPVSSYISSPEVHLISPSNNTFTSVSSQMFSCNITSTGIANLTLNIWNSTGSLNYTNTTTLTGATTNSTNWTVILPYDNSWRWNCLGKNTLNDANYNQEGNYTITLDRVAPSINFTSPSLESGSYTSDGILANTTASDSSLKNITIRLYNSTRVLINSTNSTTSSLYINFSGLNDGLYFFNASAYDNAGNVNDTETRNVTVDKTKPQWSDPFSNETTIYNNMTVKFNASWTNSALAGYIFSINQSGTFVNSSYISFSGTMNVSENISLITANVGTNVSWYFWANDSAGNSNQTALQSFVVQSRPTSLTFSVNQTMYHQGTAPEEFDLFESYIPFQARYVDGLGNPISGASCYVTNDETNDNITLTYNTTSGNYTENVSTHQMYDVVTFNVSCSKQNYNSAVNNTSTQVWFLAYLWDYANLPYKNDTRTSWLRKEPTKGNVATLTSQVNTTVGNNSIFEFPFLGNGDNGTFSRNFNFISIHVLRLNVSVSDSSCSPKLCLSIDDAAGNRLIRECGVPQAIPANTPTLIEANLNYNITVEQGEYAEIDLSLNCSSAVNENVSVYYNYSLGENANLELHYAKPFGIASTRVIRQSDAGYYLGPNQNRNVSINIIDTFNNSYDFNQYIDFFSKSGIHIDYPNSIIPNTTDIYNSTGQLWASDNVSASPPNVAIIYSDNRVSWATEDIPAFNVINETRLSHNLNALRDNETLVTNSALLKEWNINIFDIYVSQPHNRLQNITIWTNYSTYGVYDYFNFTVNMINSTGSYDISSEIVVNTSVKTITFPTLNSSLVSYTVTATTDSCTYSGFGNWEVNCSNNCSISSNIDLLGNNISMIGVGNFILSANVSNFEDIVIAGVDPSNRCEVYCLAGGCFR